MKERFLSDLVSPSTNLELRLKNEIIENNEIKEGVLYDAQGNEYKISNFIPRFVKSKTSDTTKQSFSYKWNTFVDAAISKQEENKHLFLQHYGLDTKKFRNYLSNCNKILDVGCGIGYISNWLSSETNGNVFGVDLSESVNVAYEHFSKKSIQNLQFIQADIAELPFKENTFDLIICKEMIHHTPEPRKIFGKLIKFLKKNGSIFIYVYNKKGPIREFCDDYFRKFTTKLSVDECHKFAEAMTELGRSLREMKVNITVPKDIPYLNIKSGEYDLQRFIYWNIFKCWWDDKGNRDYSNAVNFDWYHPPYAFRYEENEFKKWFEEENFIIKNFNSLDSGFAVRATKS